MANITPLVSGTAQPGYVPNENAGVTYSGTPIGGINNTQYRQTLAELMASMWAHGGESRKRVLELMSPVWYSAKYGEPDPTDGNAIPGRYSAQTILAFSRFASDYKGGNPDIDNIIPYVPPSGNDFIETPEQTAIRIAQENFERELDAELKINSDQIAAAAAEGFADRQLSAAETNAQVAAQMETIKGNIKTAAMAAFNSAFSNEVQKFTVEASIYNNQQNIQSANLQSAGNLSSVFQQLMDERTNKAITAQLNPGDYLARESQVRAMNAPQGTENPAYSNYDKLTQIIEMLMNTQGGGVKPTAPDQNAFIPPPTLQGLMNYQPTAPAPVVAQQSGYVGSTPATPPAASPAVPPAVPATPTPSVPLMAPPQAPGGVSSSSPGPSAPASNSGQYSGVPNESVSYLTPGQRALVVTGLAGPSYGRDYSSYKVYDPNRNNYQYGSDDEIAPGSSVWIEKLAYGGNTNSNQFMTGDPQRDGKPNPEVVTIHNPGPRTRVSVDPVKDIRSMGKKHLKKMKKFAYGSDMFDPSSLQLKTYKDEDYQNLPSLRYLQGNMPTRQYETLATGNTTGAFGQQIPESGSINYNKYLRLAKDPVSLAMVASSYKAGSRDLFAEVARAKARAPFGQAVQTSIIRS